MNFEHFTDDKGNTWVRRRSTPLESMRWAGVPSRFWSFAAEPHKTLAVDFAMSLLEGGGLLLVLSGGTGCGKSTACAWALSKRPGLWVHGPDLAKPEPPDPDAWGARRKTLDERMREAGLLVLDDVGIEHSPGGYAASRITDVLEFRESNKLPSIVTTNLTAAGFRVRYGERLASRTNGDPLGWQQIAGPDLRVKHWTEAKERDG